MKALLKSYHKEDMITLELVDVSDDHDFGGGPYQDTVPFAVGSNQTIVPIEDEDFPPNGEVLHGSPGYEVQEVVESIDFYPDRVDVNFRSGVFTHLLRPDWRTLVREGVVHYDREFGDGTRAIECMALPTLNHETCNPTPEPAGRDRRLV